MALVSATLERNGYGVVCVESGAEALRLLEKGQFLGVVSDMRTPGGVDGAQVHPGSPPIAPISRTKSSSLPATMPTRKRLRRCARSCGDLSGEALCVQDLISAVEKAMGKARERAARNRPSAGKTSSVRLLIVDDEHIIRKLCITARRSPGLYLPRSR